MDHGRLVFENADAAGEEFAVGGAAGGLRERLVVVRAWQQ